MLLIASWRLVEQRRWTAQEEAAKHKESLRETSQLYDTKAKALSLIPSGTTAAKVRNDIPDLASVNILLRKLKGAFKILDGERYPHENLP